MAALKGGIRQVGQKAAKVLAMHFGTLDKLMAATEDELMAIPDVSNVTKITAFLIKY